MAEYDSVNIQVLKGLEAVRIRPAMYIGDTGKKGLHHLVWEIIDNSVDEAMAGHCNQIDIIISKDGETISVEDNGRGVPVSIHPTENKSSLEVVMTVLHAGGKFDGQGYAASGGLHGVGASCVNALSDYLLAEVWRDGGYYTQEYNIGVPKTSVKKIRELEKKDKQHGTKITFHADKSIFKEGIRFDETTLLKRMREVVFLNRGLTINFRNESTGTNEKFFAQGGIADYVKYLTEARTNVYPSEPIYGERKVPLGTREGTAVIEIALNYGEEDDEAIISFANNINTVDGGTHTSGFKTSMTRIVNQFARNIGKLKEKDNNLSGDDVREGLTAIVSVRFPQPEFVGQTKAKLGTVEIEGLVSVAVSEILTEYFDKNSSIIKRVVDRALTAQEARDAAKKHSALVKRRSFLGNNSRLPGKLADCNSNKREISELFIVEGNSAGGSAKDGRDPETQAILPIRGKIINAEKNDIAALLNNNEIQSLILAIGTGFKDDFELEKRRYDKVVIMCLAGDTKIRTLNGKHPDIQTLANEGKPVWVWCKYGNKLIPKLVNPPTPTRIEKEWLKITFTDGIVECTKDHLFAVNSPDPDDSRIIWKTQGLGYNVPYIKACDLTTHDSICHARFRYRNLYLSKAYEQVSFNSRKFFWTHQYVWKAFASQNEQSIYESDDCYDLHHDDFNELNNSPDNLKLLTCKEHTEIHFRNRDHSKSIMDAHGRGAYVGSSHFIKYNKTSDHSLNIQSHHKDGTYSDNPNFSGYNGTKEQLLELQRNWSSDGVYRSKEYIDALKIGIQNSFADGKRQKKIAESVKSYWKANHFDRSMARPLVVIRRILSNGICLEELNATLYDCNRPNTTASFSTVMEKFQSREALIRYCSDKLKLNCRVSNIENVTGEKQFYCFNIPGVSNFALENGIISGNCDADDDGCHIATLLLAFFYRYMRQLVTDGYVYLAKPPLFRVDCGKERLYCFDEKEMSEAVKRLGDKSKVVRFKGLGEMDAEELSETTMQKAKRRLIQLTVSDLGESERVLSILMGSNVQARKTHIAGQVNSVIHAN
jgi:DNA gyrase subunit B